MATEPALAQRIMDAATAYANAVQEAIQTWGAGEWTGHHDEATAEELATLRALAARADAAERLAVAGDVYWGAIEAYDTSENEDDWDELLVGLKSRRVQLDNALAAWRAITEEVTDG